MVELLQFLGVGGVKDGNRVGLGGGGDRFGAGGGRIRIGTGRGCEEDSIEKRGGGSQMGTGGGMG